MIENKTKTLRHIAIIMDGNGRWAKKRFQPRIFGHRAGAKTVRKMVEYCVENKIEALTLFAFSTENWSRPQEEVSLLMDLFIKTIFNETKTLNKNNVRLKIIGDVARFSEKLQQAIQKAEQETGNNTRLTLNIAANYGGRWDIVNATKQCALAIECGDLKADEVSEQVLESFLQLADLPEPDLFIRTGGDYRISNFLIWQLAYTELYFTETLWPDFSENDMAEAIDKFHERERRFGKTSEQVS